MTSRERVLTALARKEPDRVPYMYGLVDTELQEEIVGHELPEYRFDLTIDPGVVAKPGEDVEFRIHYPVHPDTARKLELDAVGIRFPSPLFCISRYGRGGHGIERGLLTSWEAVKAARMPDPDNEAVLRQAKQFIDRFQGEFAVFASIRLGASSLLMSMGYDGFSYALYDDPDLVYAAVELYTDWVTRLAVNLRELGFDFMWAYDDIASNKGPIFSVPVWNDVFMPRLKKVAEQIECPWIYHSDGNLLPILDAMLPLGMSGIHPLEPGVMDLDVVKARYGKRLCMIGNIDIDYTLSKGTVEEVEQSVKERIEQLAPGGGYIVSDSNSVPYFCKAENILAMSAAVRKYRDFYGKEAADA